ncbi:hypothetical protein [Treponema sp.]|uniref:hypothetical protein n=1 Tax=Treponema sp. TaxID=166 RepID=UPI00298E3332|nr:hypothetical protein [Treponema sp.]MCR5612852.1 hypothetical protein [Treponema sp.]
MKNTKVKIFSVLALCCFTSCSFFTTSWGTGARRNLSENFSKMSTSDLADKISDPTIINDEDSARALLATLGNRNDLSSLNTAQMTSVLNLTSSASISTEVISSATSLISSAGSTSDVGSIISGILSQVGDADTTAAVTILSDTNNLAALPPSTVAMATISVVAQVAKSENVSDDIQTIQDQIETVFQNPNASIDDAVEAIIGTDASEESTQALTVALQTFKYYATEAPDAELFPGVSLSSIFGSQSGSQNP